MIRRALVLSLVLGACAPAAAGAQAPVDPNRVAPEATIDPLPRPVAAEPPGGEPSRGDDVIVDTEGRRLVRAGKGDDVVNVRDFAPGDTVRCGPGDDRVIADAGDTVAGDCEQVDRGTGRIRRDAATMTAEQKQDFVDAVLELKRTPSPWDARLTWYDQFVFWHEEAFEGNPSAHGGAGFLPWHRLYLLLFEDALRTVSAKDVTLPYWDWTSPASTSATFSDALMGGDGDPARDYAVTTGPFRKGAWRLYVRDAGGVSPFVPKVDQPEEGPHLERAMSTHVTETPTEAGIAAILNVPRYDAPSFDWNAPFGRSFRSAIEAGRRGAPAHNQIHVFVGGSFEIDGEEQTGTMGLGTSPNDPVFWLHHNNIDRLWAIWSARNGARYEPERGGPDGLNRGDVLTPFDGIGTRRTPGDLLDPAALGYGFDGAPARASAALRVPKSAMLCTLLRT